VNLPNLITVGRLLCVPIEVYLLIEAAYMAALALFVVMVFSDGLDGYLAKRNDQVTELGAMLDPLADKALLVSVFITLGLRQDLPTWLVVFVVFRDLFILGGVIVLFLLQVKVRMHPLLVSKINTGVQMMLVVLILAELSLKVDFDFLPNLMIYLAAATTAISGGAYIVSWARRMTRNGKSSEFKS